MYKCCKVVVTFFGARRRFDFYEDDTIELLKYAYENEKSIDPGKGVSVDLVFVNNSFYNKDYHRGNAYLESLSGASTKTGKIVVLPGDNIGMSFGGYNSAYQTLKDDYDYWLFCEDDLLFSEDEYYASMIKQINTDSSIGFISPTGVGSAGTSKQHAHGSIGLTKKEYLQQACEINRGILPFWNEEMDDVKFNNISKQIEHGEIAFSNIHVKLGRKIVKSNHDVRPFVRWIKGDLENLDIKEWGSHGVVSDEQKISAGISTKKYPFSFK